MNSHHHQSRKQEALLEKNLGEKRTALACLKTTSDVIYGRLNRGSIDCHYFSSRVLHLSHGYFAMQSIGPT